MGYGVITSDETGCRIGNFIIFLLLELHVMGAGYFRTPQCGLFIALNFVQDGLKCN